PRRGPRRATGPGPPTAPTLPLVTTTPPNVSTPLPPPKPRPERALEILVKTTKMTIRVWLSTAPVAMSAIGAVVADAVRPAIAPAMAAAPRMATRRVTVVLSVPEKPAPPWRGRTRATARSGCMDPLPRMRGAARTRWPAAALTRLTTMTGVRTPAMPRTGGPPGGPGTAAERPLPNPTAPMVGTNPYRGRLRTSSRANAPGPEPMGGTAPSPRTPGTRSPGNAA